MPPHLRSGEGGAIPSSSCHPKGSLVAFRMRIRRLKLLRKEKTARLDWPYPYLAIVASSVGFVGNGHSVKRAGDDACAKLIGHLELQLQRGDPPHHAGCEQKDRMCLATDGKFFMEKELEDEGQGMVSWQPPVECMVLADVLEGRVIKIGWYEKETRIWHPFRIVFYKQYKCSGPRANTARRVPWSYELIDWQVQPFLQLSFIELAPGNIARAYKRTRAHLHTCTCTLIPTWIL